MLSIITRLPFASSPLQVTLYAVEVNFLSSYFKLSCAPVLYEVSSTADQLDLMVVMYILTTVNQMVSLVISYIINSMATSPVKSAVSAL